MNENHPPSDSTSNDERRRTALEQSILRLDRKIAQLQESSRRFSWYRLAIILAAITAGFVAYSWLPAAWLWGVIIFSVAVFSIFVYQHNRLDKWIRLFELWRAIKSTDLARMGLNWSAIPLPLVELPANPLSTDLDLVGPRSLHHLLDISVSNQGSQRLATWLSQATPQPGLIASRQKIVCDLVPLTTFRSKLLLRFMLLSDERLNGQKLLDWLQVNVPGAQLTRNLILGSILVATNIALFLASLTLNLPDYWMATLLLYLAFYLLNQKATSPLLEAAVVMDRELDVFNSLLQFLETYPYGDNQALKNLCQPFLGPENRPSRLLRKIKLANIGVGLRMNPVMTFLLNLVLPWDFCFAYLMGRYQLAAAENLPLWLHTWYELEALISLANFAYLNPAYHFPSFIPGGESAATPAFQATSLGHPLLPPRQKICNDIAIEEIGTILIITGSNMAGKSTFVKTIGINLCLAYAGGPVNADIFRTRYFRLHTCIRISDSIVDGFSYFYAEVKCLRSLMEKIQPDQRYPVLYIIDEIFRGTNNRERLIGSRSFVREIAAKNGIGLIATHDLELANLAQQLENIKNYHFRDQVIAGKLSFDYKICRGPSTTTNALTIMRMEGLPVE